MEYRNLGRTDVKVSVICLGTMTWGEQNNEADAFRQMDFAVDRGVNFFDTAEAYAVPPRKETYGATETIIGNWLQKRKSRDKVVIATKVAGPDQRFPYIRDGNLRLDRRNIEAAVEASLRRLKTEFIDLYQLHWAEREVNVFGKLGFDWVPKADSGTPLEETLAALDAVVRAGKVRHVGLSNETPWGTMRYLTMAEAGKGPRMVSIQNAYSLLNRSFEVGLGEVALREACGLLAYSPLAMGALSGKYLGGQRPAGARLTIYPRFQRYLGPQAEAATAAYGALAKDHGLDPAQMALAFIAGRPFVTSVIIGATTMAQLEANIGAADIALDKAVQDGIEAIHKVHTYPSP